MHFCVKQRNFVRDWHAFEPYGRFFLGFYLSRTCNISTAEFFLLSLIDRCGRHPVYSDGASWYLAACRSFRLKHSIYDTSDRN